ncbi:MAG: ribonuclease HII [Desulfovibrio sp.]|nr:ribonuclease HII [Desulfovibrio sp.]
MNAHSPRSYAESLFSCCKPVSSRLRSISVRTPSSLTAGLDEAGRGCLAGPVVAAAVILPARYDLPGLNDSKACSATLRERLNTAIRASALAWGLGVVWPRTIDRINILQSTFVAMSHAVRVLRQTPTLLLVDGNMTVPTAILTAHWHKGHRAQLPGQQAIVGGDKSEPAISAASILAKTFRDRLMRLLARRWSGYGFEKHKGYGTQEHLQALRRLGPCPLHRLTFQGVAPTRPKPEQGRFL